MDMDLEIWVVEFSHLQQAFHIESLKDQINHHLESYATKREPHTPDWVIIGCAIGHKAASMLCDDLKETVRGFFKKR